ncbi:MAG: hypothetical protein ACI4QC_03765 [Thermoguttaceae bacterium]
MFEEYSNALRKFCEEQGDLFIDPNPYIKSILDAIRIQDTCSIMSIQTRRTASNSIRKRF